MYDFYLIEWRLEYQKTKHDEIKNKILLVKNKIQCNKKIIMIISFLLWSTMCLILQENNVYPSHYSIGIATRSEFFKYYQWYLVVGT